MHAEEKIIMTLAVVCGILGVVFGYFFTNEGVQIIAGIWFAIAIVFYVLGDGFKSESIVELIVGWAMFGISLAVTVALLHYDFLLSPLLSLFSPLLR